MASPAAAKALDLSARFPGVLNPDSRPGYSGWIVR